MSDANELYEGREQTRVKHEILRRYLEQFAQIVGFNWPSITYVDGFSGPWQHRSDDFHDTSFAIALNELRRARVTHANLILRCVFVEKNKVAYQTLRQYCQGIDDDVEIQTFNSEFEKVIPEVIEFIRRGRDTFPFVLIDPTGYSGFSMSVIEPLLQLKPGEVLINFMLEFIRRSIEQVELRECYRRLFGTDDYFHELKGLSGIDRDDAISEKYCEALAKRGRYAFVQRATVLHPDKDRLNFQLVYATRHPKGVTVFKRAERDAMRSQEVQRANLDQKKRALGGQKSLFEPSEMPDSNFYTSLRIRYLRQARQQVVERLKRSTTTSYDHMWRIALSFPMVWEADLRGWLKQWRDRGNIEWLGLSSSERVLKQDNSEHAVRLVSKDLSVDE